MRKSTPPQLQGPHNPLPSSAQSGPSVSIDFDGVQNKIASSSSRSCQSLSPQQATMSGAAASGFKRFLNSPTGPKTVHFWVSSTRLSLLPMKESQVSSRGVHRPSHICRNPYSTQRLPIINLSCSFRFITLISDPIFVSPEFLVWCWCVRFSHSPILPYLTSQLVMTPMHI